MTLGYRAFSGVQVGVNATSVGRIADNPIASYALLKGAPPPGTLAAHSVAARRASIQVDDDDIAARSRELLEEWGEHLTRWIDQESDPGG